MIAINFSKQQALDANPKAMQKLDWNANTAMNFFILEEVGETNLDFSQETVKLP